MKHGICASRKDRLNGALFQFIYKHLPIGEFCSRHAPKIVVRDIQLSCPQVKREIKLVQITDIHFDPDAGIGLNNVKEVIDLALAQEADAYLLTGDFIIDRCQQPEAYASLLKRLAQAKPTFATFGNHDGGRWAAGVGGHPNVDQVRAILSAANIAILYNENIDLACRGETLKLVGLSDLWAGDFQPEQAFAGTASHAGPIVVMSHNPDTLEHLLPHRWDLMLSGHTHGGQVVLPWIGAPWTPLENKAYRYGLFNLGQRWLYVSAGTGGVFQWRVNCPPEITLIRLVPKAGET